MFQRLQQKWKVNGLQLVLILCTFAIGGSLTGFAGRKLMNFIAVERGWLWVVVYIILVTLLWPVSVLLVSVFFGQYRFFISYLKKIGGRMGLVNRESNPDSYRDKSQKSEAGTAVNEQQATGNTQQTAGDVFTIHHPIAIGSLFTNHIAIFASGAGSNAQKIIDHFRQSRAY